MVAEDRADALLFDEVVPPASTNRASCDSSSAEGQFDVEEWFSEFLAKEYRALVTAIHLAYGPRAGAEDAVAEALVRAWEQCRRHREIHRLREWVATVAFNQARRSVRRSLVVERLLPRTHSSSAEAADYDDVLRHAAVWAALKRLSTRQRQAVVAHYYLDLDVRTTARALAVTEGTVKSHLSRARAALASASGGRGEDDED